MKRAVLFASLLLIGCSDGSGPTEPEVIVVAGQWEYRASNITDGSGFVCSIVGLLQLNQANRDLSGSYEAIVECGDQAGLVGGTIVSGRLDGRSIRFDLDTSDFHHEGTVAGNSMSGTVRVRLIVGSAERIFTGNWAASRCC